MSLCTKLGTCTPQQWRAVLNTCASVGSIYKTHIFVTQWWSCCFSISYFPARYVGVRFWNETYPFPRMVYKVLRHHVWFTKCCDAICVRSNQEHRANSFSFWSVLGSFTCVHNTQDQQLSALSEGGNIMVTYFALIRTQVSSTARHCWGVHVPIFVHKDMRKSCFFSPFLEIKCFPQRITQFP